MDNSQALFPLKFSIIIPLEFNRGLAVKCIRAWAEGQSFSRADFEILVAASETHDGEELKIIQELLFPQDKLLQFPVSHDMNLVTAAAGFASGEVLVFTESHCLPEPNFIERSASVLAEHPEWGGFSGRSIALTHNLLSIVESELYERDITENLTNHPWLKVLDQCFVIKRKDYQSVGGIDPSYGHFAEWHLAARFHRQGIKIGYAPDVNVGHYYIGDMADLETFTLDFVEGEMLCASRTDTDPCSPLFVPPVEWTGRSRWNQALIARLFDHLRTLPKASRPDPSIHHGWKFYSLKRTIRITRARLAFQHALLNALLLIRWKQGAKITFQRWIVTCVRLGRLSFLDRLYTQSAALQNSPHRTLAEWTPSTAPKLDSVGFHELEDYQSTVFRWTEPTGCIELPAGQGTWRITLHLLPVVTLQQVEAALFTTNGKLVPPPELVSDTRHIEIRFTNTGHTPVYLAWAMEMYPAPGDSRRLGLPISKIEWQREETPAPVRMAR